MNAEARRSAIREILTGRDDIATQDALRRALGARGIRVAQATLSRDMHRLGVVRESGAAGARYTIAGGPAAGLPVDPMRLLVDDVRSNGVLVVVRTKAGAASTVARVIDEARLPGLLGTLAGDDTVFLAPVRARGAASLATAVQRLFGG